MFYCLHCHVYRYSVDKGKLMYHTRKGTWVEAIFGKSQRVQILKACHSDGTAGHLGRTKTFYKVSQRYYWPGIFNDVEQFVSFISATQSQLYFMHVRNL